MYFFLSLITCNSHRNKSFMFALNDNDKKQMAEDRPKFEVLDSNLPDKASFDKKANSENKSTKNEDKGNKMADEKPKFEVLESNLPDKASFAKKANSENKSTKNEDKGNKTADEKPKFEVLETDGTEKNLEDKKVDTKDKSTKHSSNKEKGKVESEFDDEELDENDEYIGFKKPGKVNLDADSYKTWGFDKKGFYCECNGDAIQHRKGSYKIPMEYVKNHILNIGVCQPFAGGICPPKEE